MIIKIFGTESLGVRGLSCSVELSSQRIFIDPGIALGWSRYGFMPHPFQIAMGAGIRDEIIKELKDTSDVIFSHFDGDHCPLGDANPYQLGIQEIKNSLASCRIWSRGPDHCPPTQQRRRKNIADAIHKDLQNAEGVKQGPMEFSFPVPHGQQGRKENMVMMSRIEEGGVTFVHASDIQLLDVKTIKVILDWKPDIVIASGPPLYRYSSSSFQAEREQAWENALALSNHVDTLIIDHHLFRSEEGVGWLRKLGYRVKKKIFCAAGFMKRAPLLLEAWRRELYEGLPVPVDWHEDYKQGKADIDHYRVEGWDFLMRKGKITPCKWYPICPIKAYTDQGKLERYWIENYCLVANKHCIRYQMEEKGEYHPDNMLPNGEIRRDL